MCAREEVDKKNMDAINKITKSYPIELKKYINSLARKTTYTKKAYAYYVSCFLDYLKENNGDYDYNKVKPMDIDSYMENIRCYENGKEKSAMYRAAQLAAISGFFKFLRKNDIIKSNPCENVEVPKDNEIKEIITIENDDLDVMIKNIKKGVGTHKARSTQKKWINRDIALITLGISTGLRIGAIVGIDIDDINFEEKIIYVTEKGNIKKEIFIGTKTAKIIKDWIDEREKLANDNEKALFICQGGKRISVRTVQDRFKKISEGTGKNITPHKMRATCATKLLEKTGNIYLVKDQLGHKNISSTEHYAKNSNEAKRRAAELLDNL